MLTWSRLRYLAQFARKTRILGYDIITAAADVRENKVKSRGKRM